MAKAKKIYDTRERLIKYLRSHKMRSTPERMGILDAAVSRPGIFRAEDIHADVRDLTFPISLATVYNTFSLLVSAGILRCVRLPEHPSRFYEVSGEFSSQAYFVCRSCGSCKKFRGSGLTARLREYDFGDITPDYFSVNIYGLCRKCSKKIDSDKTNLKNNPKK